MQEYQKPVVLCQEEMIEGVYLESGNTAEQGPCQSIYMNGVYHAPIAHGVNGANTMFDRGCEGCPAAQGACRPDQGPFGLPLKPTWERKGFAPNADYVYP